MANASNKAKRLGLKILDGSMGNYLQRNGLPFDGAIWSLSALINTQYHVNVIDAHKSYLKAGCNILTTNTYSCVPLYLSKVHKNDEMESLYILAVDLATSARNNYVSSFSTVSNMPMHQQNNILIAGGIPPLTESYRADKLLSEAQSMYYYNRIINAFQNTDIDLYLIETMTCFDEAKYVLNSMICNNTYNKDIYLFFAIGEDGALRDGQQFNDMMVDLEPYLDVLRIKYIGFNCCKPESFDIVMSKMNDKTLNMLSERNILIGCYPNGLADVPRDCNLDNDGAKEIRKDLSPEELYNKYFKQWIQKYNNFEYMFSLMGGCCAINPEHMEYAVTNIQRDFPSLLHGECIMK